MSAVLYTPEVLALATGLAGYRLDETLPLRGEARSRSCGSTLTLGMRLDDQDQVAQVGIRSQACAIGQASAAIFAQAAVGRSADDIRATAEAVADWLNGEGTMPAWPGFPVIATVRDYPGRYGALLLPWTAALQLLCTRAAAS